MFAVATIAAFFALKLGPAPQVTTPKPNPMGKHSRDGRRRIQKRVFALFQGDEPALLGVRGTPAPRRCHARARAASQEASSAPSLELSARHRPGPSPDRARDRAFPRRARAQAAAPGRCTGNGYPPSDARVERRLRVARRAGCRTTGRPGRRSGRSRRSCGTRCWTSASARWRRSRSSWTTACSARPMSAVICPSCGRSWSGSTSRTRARRART